MNLEELPASTVSSIKSLQLSVENVLNEQSSPHTKAISKSLILPDEDIEITMGGGDIRAPSKPPFKYAQKQISDMHRGILKSCKGGLCALIVRAERAEESSRWATSVKLVSKSEYMLINQERRIVDEEVKAELARINREHKYVRVSGGRYLLGKSPLVVGVGSSGTDRNAPTARILDAIEVAGKIYKKHDLDLQIAYWTMSEGKIEFREYFE